MNSPPLNKIECDKVGRNGTRREQKKLPPLYPEAKASFHGSTLFHQKNGSTLHQVQTYLTAISGLPAEVYYDFDSVLRDALRSAFN